MEETIKKTLYSCRSNYICWRSMQILLWFLDDMIEETPVQRDEEIADRECSITVKDEKFDCQESVNTSKQR